MIFMTKEATGLENLDKELETLYQPKAAQTKAQPKRAAASAKTIKAKKSTKKIVLSKGKRKRAVARATLVPGGSGRLTINGVDVNLIRPKEIRELMTEAVKATKAASDIAAGSDIFVNSKGGGFSGQAQAVRTAIAKVLVKASPSPDSLRSFY
ncbi:30S ribosomal protein S9P, partial [mine drainage metagenome]